MRFVRNKTKHYKISILTIDAVTSVWAVSRLIFHHTNMFHDLVLAFAGNVMTTEDNLELSPAWIFFDLFTDEVLDRFRHLGKKFGSGGNAV